MLLLRAYCEPLDSSNIVRLLAHVFTGENPQSEWLKHDESNRVYWFDKILILRIFVDCFIIKVHLYQYML